MVLRGQSKHDVGDLVEDGEALALFRVIAVDDDDVLVLELSRLTGLVISQVVGELDLRIRCGGKMLYVDGNSGVASIPQEFASPENRRKLVHLLVVFVEQAGQAVHVPTPVVHGLRPLAPEAHLVSRFKQVQWPIFVFDKHIYEGVVDHLPDE